MQLLELLENGVELVLGNADTGVVHLDNQHFVAAAAFDPHSPTVGVPNRVANKVLKDRAQHLGIRVNQFLRYRELKTKLFFSGQRGPRVRDLLQEVADWESPALRLPPRPVAPPLPRSFFQQPPRPA